MKIVAWKTGGILIALCLQVNAAFCQQNVVDSLITLLEKKLPDTAEVDVLNEIAFNYIYINPELAKDNVTEAFKLATEINYSDGKARSYMVKGGIEWSQGNYTEALNLIFDALKYYERTENKVGIVKSYNNLGEVYKNIGNFEKSLEFHQKALKAKQKWFPDLVTFTSQVNIAGLYIRMDRLAEAKTLYHIILKNHNDVPLQQLALAYSGLGKIALKKNQHNLALDYLNKSLSISKKTNDQRGVINAYYDKSIAFKGLSSYDSAFYYLNRALNKAKTYGARDILANSYLHMSQLDSIQQNYKDAYLHYRRYAQIKDSVLNEVKHSQIARIQTAYETELLSKENEANVIKVKQQNTLIIGIFILMFFAIAIAWAFYRQQKNQQKVNFLLASKNSEIQRQSEKLILLNKKLERLNEGLEGKVKERTKMLIEQNKKLAEYAYTNAHELRAPVANILGLVNLMTYSSKLSDKEQEIVEHLQKATTELDGVIKNIRHKLEKGENFNQEILFNH